MRYLISYGAGPLPSERLRTELTDLGAEPFHGCAWMLETRLTTGELTRQLRPFLDDGDRLLAVDVTGREVLVADYEPADSRTAAGR